MNFKQTVKKLFSIEFILICFGLVTLVFSIFYKNKASRLFTITKIHYYRKNVSLTHFPILSIILLYIETHNTQRFSKGFKNRNACNLLCHNDFCRTLFPQTGKGCKRICSWRTQRWSMAHCLCIRNIIFFCRSLYWLRRTV